MLSDQTILLNYLNHIYEVNFIYQSFTCGDIIPFILLNTMAQLMDWLLKLTKLCIKIGLKIHIKYLIRRMFLPQIIKTVSYPLNGNAGKFACNFKKGKIIINKVLNFILDYHKISQTYW